MSAFYDLNKTPRNILNQAIVRAIVSGNNGAWFDPEDMSTMFQDAAGTTPVTALEQPVGKWLDKSGNNYHAAQPITASRPTLSARYNQLLNSATLSTQSVTTVAAKYTLSFTGTGSVTLSGTATGTLAGTGANNRVSLSFTPTAGTLTLTVTGSVTLAMLALGTLTTYQAITTATDYDSVGWPKYIQSDGIDDYFYLPYLNLANSNAGVSAIFSADNIPQSAIVAYILSEKTTSATYPIYGLAYIDNAGNQKGFITDNAGVVKYNTGFYKPKSLAQVNSIIDTKSNIKNYLNSSQTSSVDYSAPVVATDNNTIFAGNTGGRIDNYTKMKLYGLIITKSALSDTDRRRCEKFLASRLSTLGVTLS